MNERVIPCAPLDPQQLVEIAAHPVDVGAEMDVRVEELGVLRQLGAHEVLEALDEGPRAPKDVLHEPESTDGGWGAIREDARFETRRTGRPPVRGKRRSHLGNTRTAYVDDSSFARGRGSRA